MIDILMFIFGLVGLVVGADLLVRGAAKLALSFGVSALVVGLTVVSMGTSAPEVAVSVSAALKGSADLALGNVLGSNIFNILGVLGLSALITPLLVSSQIVRQEVPIMIGVSLLLAVFSLDGRLGLVDSAILVILMFVYTAFLIHQSRRQNKELDKEFSEELPTDSKWDSHWAVQVLLVVVGLVVLVYGAKSLVGASVNFAKAVGVSDMVIGLTIVAIGTSLPEVATSVIAAFRGEKDIAIGNVIGSNIFNIVGCLGISGLASGEGLAISPSVLSFDMWVMLAVAFSVLPIFVSSQEMTRRVGFLFVFYYAVYATHIVLMAQQSEWLSQLNSLMLGIVLPLTILAFMYTLIRGKA